MNNITPYWYLRNEKIKKLPGIYTMRSFFCMRRLGFPTLDLRECIPRKPIKDTYYITDADYISRIKA